MTPLHVIQITLLVALLAMVSALAGCGVSGFSHPMGGSLTPPAPQQRTFAAAPAALVPPLVMTNRMSLTWTLTGYTAPEAVTGLEVTEDMKTWTATTIQPVPCRYTVTNNVWWLLPQTFTNTFFSFKPFAAGRAFAR
jgi:hypothetical protein